MQDTTQDTTQNTHSDTFGGDSFGSNPVPGGDPFSGDPFSGGGFGQDVPEGVPQPPSFSDDAFAAGESYATKSRENTEEVSDKKAAFIETVEEINDALPEAFGCYGVEASDTRPYTLAESAFFKVVAKTMTSSKLYLEAKDGHGESEDAQIQAAQVTERLQSVLTDRDVTPAGYEPWSADKVGEAIKARRAASEKAEARAKAHAEAIKENRKRDKQKAEQEKAEQEKAEREVQEGIRTVRTPEGEILTVETATGGAASQITMGFSSGETPGETPGEMPGEYLDPEAAARRIKSRPGRETVAYFCKRTSHTVRRMIFSFHPRERGQVHDKKNNLVRVYDLEKEGLRSISLERVLDVQDQEGNHVADPLEARAARSRRASRAPVPVY